MHARHPVHVRRHHLHGREQVRRLGQVQVERDRLRVEQAGRVSSVKQLIVVVAHLSSSPISLWHIFNK